MILAVLMAAGAGVLIGLSRQLNGRLALETSALAASGVNHLVGFVALVLAGLALGLIGLEEAPPWWAWLGGPGGVLFVAMGSWLVARLGAAATALLTIAGQMLAGALLDTLRGAEGVGLRFLGVLLILGGVALSRR